MLVVSLKIGESVTLSIPQTDGSMEQVRIVITERRCKQVAIGLDAPRKIIIRRDKNHKE